MVKTVIDSGTRMRGGIKQLSEDNKHKILKWPRGEIDYADRENLVQKMVIPHHLQHITKLSVMTDHLYHLLLHHRSGPVRGESEATLYTKAKALLRYVRRLLLRSYT